MITLTVPEWFAYFITAAITINAVLSICHLYLNKKLEKSYKEYKELSK